MQMKPNTPVLQDTLDRLTAKIDRWRQNSWAFVPDGVDEITPENVETGTYHDFQLSKDFLEWYNSEEAQELRQFEDLFLPIADCGTGFCVAGDVCVANGYTFVAPIGESYASQVVKTEELETALRHPAELRSCERAADHVAQEVLGLTYAQAQILFHQSRSLPEIWGIGYAITGGKLRLPETLPESTCRGFWGDKVPVFGTADATETRRVIFEALRTIEGPNDGSDWRGLALDELEKLGAVEA